MGAYDPYTDKYYTTTLSGTGAAAVNADFVGVPKALSTANTGATTSVVSNSGTAGSGKIILGTAAAIAGFAAGDKVLIIGTSAACTIDGAYTVKSKSSSDFSLTLEES